MCCCIEFDKTCTRIHHCQDWYQNSQNIIHHVTNYFPARLFTLSWNFLRYSWKQFLCQALLYLPLKLTPLTQIFLLKRKKIKGLFIRNCIFHCSILMLKKVRFSAALVPIIYEPIWQLITHAWRYWLLRVLWHILMLIDVFRWTRVGITTQYK